MEVLLTASNVTFVLGLLGILFSIFLYFKNPQEDLEKKQALTEKDVDSKTTLLEHQVSWEKASNEKKFEELGKRLDESLALAQNHTHTIDVKVDNLVATVNTMNLSMTNEITKKRVIINERLPKI